MDRSCGHHREERKRYRQREGERRRVHRVGNVNSEEDTDDSGDDLPKENVSWLGEGTLWGAEENDCACAEAAEDEGVGGLLERRIDISDSG